MTEAETSYTKASLNEKSTIPLLPKPKSYLISDSNENYNLPAQLTNDDIDCDDVKVTYQPPKTVDRATWGGKIEFFLSCVSFAVGLGNVWRFPYLCHKNGGGAFILPYIIMLILVGLPLFFLEFAFGQFASLGPISVWSVSPLFKGVGYAMVSVSWLLSLYYNVIVAQSLFFLVSSFTSELPWMHCNNSWNNNLTCIDVFTNISLSSTQRMFEETTSPAEDYYERYVLEMSDGIDKIGFPSWKLTLCLLLAWTITAIVLIKGVQSLGKVSYFTAVFPYIILAVLLGRGVFLPGSMQGILYYITPQFHRLKDPRVWVDAATQIFFSLGCCSGSLIAMSSYNPFKNNCCRDAVIVACINCATSVYAGFVVFANLGFMSQIKNISMEKVAKAGPGLAFIVYPEAITQMPIPPLWSAFFFIMLTTLGLGSQFAIVETVMSGLEDEARRLGYLTSKWSKMGFRVSLCFVNFLLGIPMLCNGGYYLLFLIDWAMSGYPLLFICIAEIVVICYSYGIKQFLKDVELMTNVRPNWYWRICWLVITPGITVALIIFSCIGGANLKLDSYQFPNWAVSMAYLISSFPVVCIPIWLIYKYCVEGGWILFTEFLKPVHEWGPAQDEHRAEFIEMIRSNDSIKRNEFPGSNVCISSSFIPPGLINTVDLNPQQTGSTAYLGSTMDSEKGFFQSKLNVAEKLTQAHTKEMAKKVGSEISQLPDGLTASQLALTAMSANKEIQPYSFAYNGQKTLITEATQGKPETNQGKLFTIPNQSTAAQLSAQNRVGDVGNSPEDGTVDELSCNVSNVVIETKEGDQDQEVNDALS